MSFDDFIKKYEGKKVDFDQAYGSQCTDLWRQYVKEVLEVPQSPAVVGAADIWNTYLKDRFDRIGNTPEGVPNNGDIVIWNKNVGGGFGHVAIFISGTAKSFTSFDQNWPVGSPCHKQNHLYGNVLGWLRLKQSIPELKYTETEMDRAKKEGENYWRLYESERNKNTELEREIERLRNELSNCNSDLRREVGAAKDREAEKDKRHSDFIASLAEPLGTRQDETEIIVEVKRLIDVEHGMEKARDGEAAAKKELADYKLEVENKLEGLRGVDSSMPRTLSGVFEALVRFWNKSRQGKVQLSPEASAWDKITSYLWKAR